MANELKKKKKKKMVVVVGPEPAVIIIGEVQGWGVWKIVHNERRRDNINTKEWRKAKNEEQGFNIL